MTPKSWMSTGITIMLSWAFFFGYVMAIGFGRGMSWDDTFVTLYFPEGGMTGQLFVELFNVALWAFFILTIAMAIFLIASILERTRYET